MIWKTIILLSFALCVLGDGHHAVSEQHFKINHEHHGHHGELTHIGSHKPEHHEEYAWSYPSYEFSYSVHDPHTHDNKGQHETRKGDEVKGEYWLIQPDGRKRTVKYHADKHSGFHATVHYSDHHHHIIEHHGYKDDYHKDSKEDDKKDHHEKKKDKKKKDSSEESSSQSESDESSEESRGHDDGVVRWGYKSGDDSHNSDKNRKRDSKSDESKSDESKSKESKSKESKSNESKSKESKSKESKSNESKSKEDDRDSEESKLWEERRKFDERRGYPSELTPYFGHASRINPRFYSRDQQRKVAKRN